MCLLDEATGSCRPPRFYTLDHHTIWAPVRVFAVEREPKTRDVVRFRTRAGGIRLSGGQAFDLAIRCQYKFYEVSAIVALTVKIPGRLLSGIYACVQLCQEPLALVLKLCLFVLQLLHLRFEG